MENTCLKKIGTENMLSEFKKENLLQHTGKNIYISRCVKDLSIWEAVQW